MPRSFIRWRIASLSPIDGSFTEGFCRPSRSVSSKKVTFFGVSLPLRLTSFQSNTNADSRSLRGALVSSRSAARTPDASRGVMKGLGCRESLAFAVDKSPMRGV